MTQLMPKQREKLKDIYKAFVAIYLVINLTLRSTYQNFWPDDLANAQTTRKVKRHL